MTRLKDWLEISTDGFAQRQADRRPEHLIKELIQNSLDITEGMPNGEVSLTITTSKKGTQVTVVNNGPPIDDPSDLRRVFCTGKEESFLLRGRLGQGFKEILSLAIEARVESGVHRLHFHRVKGERVTDLTQDAIAFPGTRTVMLLPWTDPKTPEQVLAYARTLLVPKGRRLILSGNEPLPHRPAVKSIPVTLPTELFTEGRWVRRERPGTVDLVALAEGESPTIYEMGIPICPLDWTQPYHINIGMRVPMNPRRDAVAAGYLAACYAAILPTLMEELPGEALRDEWVSSALDKLPDEDRRDVVVKALGSNAVRSTPTAGRHDFDSDARELGHVPVPTALLPSGLRRAATDFLPTSREVEMQRRETVAVAHSEAAPRPESAREQRVEAWCRWICKEVLQLTPIVRFVPSLVINGEECAAAWGSGGHLSLNRKQAPAWKDPLEPRALGLLIHEMAHELAPHHGDDFRRAVERVAGRVAKVMLLKAETIRTEFGDLGARAANDALLDWR